jgi:hypothetical protein
LRSDVISLTQRFQSLLGARCGINGRNPKDGKGWTIFATARQVLKVALLLPVFGRKILLSSHKGAWDRVRKGSVPLEVEGHPDKGFLGQPRLWIIFIPYATG